MGVRCRIDIIYDDDLTRSERKVIDDLMEPLYKPDYVPGDDRPIKWMDFQGHALARVNGEIIGHAGCVGPKMMINGEKVGVIGIGGVIVDEDYRRLGIANRMIDKLLYGTDWQEETKFGMLFCNKSMVPIYSKMGWTRRSEKVLFDHYGFLMEMPKAWMVTEGLPKISRGTAVGLLTPPW